jgi:S1-C subfamily serine protease
MATNKSPGILANLSTELADVVERVAPAVVRVDDGSRLTATGTLWSAEGIVVTTSHGVERDESLSIELGDGKVLPAAIIGRDPDTDLAALKVNATGLPFVPQAESPEVRVGNLALALARPGHGGLQATLGIISARLESQSHGQEEYILHTDAVLYPGFSGGPLVNVNGKVVGILNLMFGRGKGVALGTPITNHIIQALLAHGRVQRGYLGVRTQQVMLPEGLRKSLSLSQETGLLLVQVDPGSPAEKGGLLLGDVLLAFNDVDVSDVDSLRRQLRLHSAGDTVKIRLLRGGALHTQDVSLGSEA